MERLQKCVQVDGECVGWVKRTQYIEIEFNREIRLCYTWRGTPYKSPFSLCAIAFALVQEPLGSLWSGDEKQQEWILITES
jgi:hypothetical protein